MAAAMAELLQSPSKARRLGDAARKRFEEKFSLEVTAHILTKTIFPSSEHRQIQAEEQELNIAVGQQ
jgi:glycosyltransferase involved in cell wall biosynthesis